VPQDFATEYARIAGPLPKFGVALESLITDLLKSADVNAHHVEHRVKSAASAAGKMARKIAEGGEPRSLDSFTDLLGLRVITYFQDEVDGVARLLEREFFVDSENSVDKSAALHPDQFGYISTHYVLKLSESRVSLPEYLPFAGIRFEVQIRSILQHAWAEIEHDLGYKAEAVPRVVRRRFSRLAGVLELADDEFVGLRREVSKHQENIKATIGNGALSIEVDQDSLSAFVRQERRIGQLDRSIAKAMNGVMQRQVDEEYMGRQATRLTDLGFTSIEDLSNYLHSEWELLRRFIDNRLSNTAHAPRNKRVPVPMGITLYYAGLLKHTQEVRQGNDGGVAYSGISSQAGRN
jgi:ppGpp synthetase/RelA/SpoT-type nucleotidyltranferase